MSCGTDNQGNSHLLDWMMTTKYPLGVVLMELAHQMRIRRLVLRAHWLPRLENEEADALTNLDFRHFTPELRIPVDLDTLEFGVLRGLFEHGESYLAELEKRKVEAKAARDQATRAGGESKRKRLAGKLSSLQPW